MIALHCVTRFGTPSTTPAPDQLNARLELTIPGHACAYAEAEMI